MKLILFKDTYLSRKWSTTKKNKWHGNPCHLPELKQILINLQTVFQRAYILWNCLH